MGTTATPGFDAAERLARTVAALYGGRPVLDSDAVQFELPAIAEDGAIVPMAVRCELTGVTGITLLCGVNPVPIIARFSLHPDVLPGIATRIKLASSGEVLAVVETGAGLFGARRSIRVIHGGCA